MIDLSLQFSARSQRDLIDRLTLVSQSSFDTVMKKGSTEEIGRFLEVVRRLRKECPWDKKQTHQSLAPYVLEETYEVLEAIETQNGELKEELGDLLLQICLHAEIASETGDFDFETVAKDVADKMIQRHPHVYGDVKVKDAAEVKANWVELKKQEKPDRTLLDGIPKALPALLLAYKYGYRASTVGFDWENVGQVLEKVDEELAELRAEVGTGSKEAIEMEVGDLLFTIANLSRHLKVDPETALRKSAAKFANRVGLMENALRAAGKKESELSPEQWEEQWQRAKEGKG